MIMLKNVKSIKSLKSPNSGIDKNNSIKNDFLKRNEATLENIKKLINKINRDLLFGSIENTLKNVKDQAQKSFHITKDNDSIFEGEKNDIRKKIEKKAKKKEEMTKVKIEEDLPYEKEIKVEERENDKGIKNTKSAKKKGINIIKI